MVISQAVGGRFGTQCVLQLLGLAGCLASLRLARGAARQAAAFYGMLLSAGAFVAFGHAIVSPERWLSAPADVVHAVFAAMWLGGLIGLVVVLHNRVRTARRAGEMTVPDPEIRAVRTAPYQGASGSGTSTALLERTAPPGEWSAGHPDDHSVLSGTIGLVDRFSTMGGISIGLVLVAGTVLAITEVGSVANLFETGYGQTLVGEDRGGRPLLILVAAYNRFLLVPWLSGRGVGPEASEGSGRRMAAVAGHHPT